jgi:hypothetical protein
VKSAIPSAPMHYSYHRQSLFGLSSTPLSCYTHFTMLTRLSVQYMIKNYKILFSASARCLDLGPVPGAGAGASAWGWGWCWCRGLGLVPGAGAWRFVFLGQNMQMASGCYGFPLQSSLHTSLPAIHRCENITHTQLLHHSFTQSERSQLYLYSNIAINV